MEDVGKCRGLQWLELRACAKLSDAGIKQVGLLLGRQHKALQQWQAGGAEDAAAPPVMTHLYLGGLGRLSDEARAARPALAACPFATSSCPRLRPSSS